MAYLALLEDLENRALRRERVFKERADLLSESTEWLLSRYRFPKNILMSYAVIYNQFWSERLNAPKPSQCTSSSCPPLDFWPRDISKRDWRHMRHFTADTKQNYAGSVGCIHFSGPNLHSVPVQTSPTTRH